MTENSIRVETLDGATVSRQDAAAMAALHAQVWPDFPRTLKERIDGILRHRKTSAGPAERSPRYLVVRDGRQVVAVAHTFPREIRTPAGPLVIMALSGVCVAPEQRGRHFGRAVVQAAFAAVDEGHFPFALFQTTPRVRPFYEKLRACNVSNRIVNSLADDPHANPFWDGEVMRYPDTSGWPDGLIDLLGPGY
jgi:hypothetical protein